MDRREGMSLQGSNHYYLHRGLPGSQPGLNTQPQGYNNRPSNPNVSPQPILRVSNSMGPQFNMEGSQANVIPQGFTITTTSPSGGSLSDPSKKKRGRPRKYGPDGSGSGPGGTTGSGLMTLGLSPSPSEKRKRGRPRGSGRKQRLASVGELMKNSAGMAFTPHLIHVAPGEDIAAKILAFSQQRPRAICIISGNGGVSSVTLHQPTPSSGTVSFEGLFEILCLSGSYLVTNTGGSRDRSGGLNVSLSSPDGRLIGGTVGGRLIASKPVQVVVSSFVYSGSMKATSKESESKDENSSKGVDLRNPNTDIDLA